MRVEFDASQVRELARDFGRVPALATHKVDGALAEGADTLNNRWRSIARVTAGAHGPHYPNAITNERIGLLAYVIGPESARPQGGMSFEYGSRNQPPHLDGNRAADEVFPTIAGKVGEAAMDAFGR